MGAEYGYTDAAGTLTTQAIVELTEANLPAASGESEWDEEVGFLQESGGTRQSDITQGEVAEVLDLSTLQG